VTNSERADRLLSEQALVGQEMRSALQSRSWNLAARRAQEALELVVKALLNEMGVESPRVHDPAAALADALRARRLDVEPTLLEWLTGLSARLAQIRAPAFY
jgi:HEPN domain-containing protein